MNQKGQGTIIAMAIGAILLVVILGVIFSTLSEQTTTSAVTADQFTASNSSCTKVTNNCITAITSVVNATTPGVDATGNYSVCSISGDETGILLDPADSTGNIDNNGFTANASYSEQSCAFITSGTTRTLVTLIPVLLAILVLIFILGFVALRK